MAKKETSAKQLKRDLNTESKAQKSSQETPKKKKNQAQSTKEDTKSTSTTKKRKNSRAKGASYERKICKKLEPWWDCEFHRVPASGGLRWKQDNRVTGDIVVQEDVKDFPFVIECKKREGWNFEQIIKGTGEVVSWWEQNNNDLERLGDDSKHSLLIFSKNLSPDYFMIRKRDWESLPLPYKNYFETTIYPVINGKTQEHDVVIGFLDDLLSIPKEKVVSRLL